MRLVTISLLMLVASIPARAQDPLGALKNYMKQYGYTTLVPPRANVTVGSVVSFDHHQETVVSSKCLPADKVTPSTPQPIALTVRTGTYTRNVGIDASFAKVADPTLDISGAFTDDRVQAITITLADPTESHLEAQDVKQYISHIPVSDPCFATFTNSKNLVYQTLVRVDKVTYSFANKDGKTIKLDAALLSALKINPSYKSNYDGKDTLDLTSPIYIGYRAWKVKKLPGAVAPGVSLTQQTPEALRALKTASRR